jgi:hypothetical protein
VKGDADCCGRRRARALADLGRAHRSGALAAAALGDVAADTWPSTGAINTETASLATSVAQLGKDIFAGFGRDSYPVDDPGVGSLQNAWNAFLADFNQWRDAGWFWNPSRRDELIGYRARFNALLAQWRVVPSVVTVAAPVAGDAPEKNPIEKAVDKAVDIAKWAALLVGAVAAWKVASDLGVVAKVGNLLGGGGAASEPGRRYGSAKRNPRGQFTRR